MSSVTANLTALILDIEAAARSANRDPSSIKLIAVSKTKPAADIVLAHQAGQKIFGENYAQEFLGKQKELAGLSLEWHFIGHLQSNKAKDVVGKAQLIHTIDRLSLAKAVDKIAHGLGIVQNGLIEIKIGSEETKSGCTPDDAPELLKQLAALKNLKIIGLMTIGTLTDDTNITRREFSRLRELKDELNAAKIYPTPLTELSMGMSGDFALAITEGATMIRVGTRVFGERV